MERLCLALLLALAGPAAAASARHDDLWPQTVAFPDAARLEATWDGAGTVTVTGRAGAVPGALPVLVTCPETGAAALTDARADGGFEARLAALPGSWLVVKYDPTAARGRRQWLQPPFQHPGSDVNMTYANAAPGTWLRVPGSSPPPGPGVAFDASGAAEPRGGDFHISGRQLAPAKPGAPVVVDGAFVLRVASAAAWVGREVLVDADLVLRFDSDGRARSQTGFYGSNVLTPTGLPIQTRGQARFRWPGLRVGPLAPDGTGGLRAPVRWSLPLSSGLPAGVYGVALRARLDPPGEAPGGLRASRQLTLTRGLTALPPFTLGAPRPPRLTWTLLTDVPAADGTRGVVAREDDGDFELGGHVVTQSRDYVVARLSRPSGRPLRYRLEPYLPMVAQGDRHVPNPPPLAFRFPSGSLTVRVRRPDGGVDVLGPAPFVAGRSRAPATSHGQVLDNGGGSLADVFQLTTGSSAFEYAFPAYGRYEVELDGTVEDAQGRVYRGGGVYVVHAAEPLDLEPAILPTTPLRAGDALNAGLSVLPGVPADVDVVVTHLPGSDPARARRHVVAGRANAYGVFTASRPIVLDEPGEFLVETTARHVDDNGALWMGSSRWGQVVASTDGALTARGQRGRMDFNPGAGLWFDSPRARDSGHLRFPYASGDVAWQSGDDCMMPAVTVQDRDGRVEARLRELLGGDDAASRRLHQLDSGFDERARTGELPLLLVSTGPFPPAADPRAIVSHGYYYAGAQRPGERAREVVSDDQGVQKHGYWLFDEPFAMQPGIGVAGDLPGDFKFLYGGAVWRDAGARENRYGLYGSLWVHVPVEDLRGTRVMPPFQGLNGGPGGGPLLSLDGEEVEGFIVPLSAKPGAILETGDTFSFSGAVAPPLPATVRVDIVGPDGARRSVAGRANPVGYFYRPEADFVADLPGRYRVEVAVTFDAPTSAGPLEPPYPTGGVLGAARRAYDVYVVARGSPRLETRLASRWRAPGVLPVRLPVLRPAGARGVMRYTVAMPGHVLAQGELSAKDRVYSLLYDAPALARRFPNIDVRSGRNGPSPGLVDTVWASLFFEGADGSMRARHVTLQGPDVHAP